MTAPVDPPLAASKSGAATRRVECPNTMGALVKASGPDEGRSGGFERGG